MPHFFKDFRQGGNSFPPEPGIKFSTSIQLAQFCQRQAVNETGAIRGPVDRGVVKDHHLPICAEFDIQLNGWCSLTHREPEGSQRVFGCGSRSSPVGKKNWTRKKVKVCHSSTK